MSVVGRRWAAVPALPLALLGHPQKAQALQVEVRSGSQQGQIALQFLAWQPWSPGLECWVLDADGEPGESAGCWVLMESPGSQRPVHQHSARFSALPPKSCDM